MARRSALAVIVVVTLGSTVSVRAGADAAEPIVVDYEAPATCPTRDAFLSEVRARTSRATLAQAGQKARSFQVTLARTEAGAQGSLVVTDLAQGSSRRVVDGDSCSAVASALALVVALTIDPSASTGPISLAAASEPAAAEPGLPLIPTEPPMPPSPPRPSPRLPPERTPVEKATSPRREPPGASLPLDFGLHVALDMLGTGDTLGGVVGSAIGGSLMLDRPGWLAPELRLGVSYAATESPEVLNVEYARFVWWRGELEVCPFRVRLAEALDVRPCVLGRAGPFTSEGHGVTSSRTSTRPWGELGVSMLVEWRLARPLAIEAEAGPDFPLLREEYAFQDPPKHVYKAPPVMADVRFGLAVHFP